MAANATRSGVSVPAFIKALGWFRTPGFRRFRSVALRPEYWLPLIVAALAVILLPSALDIVRSDHETMVAEAKGRIELIAVLAASELAKIAELEDPKPRHLSVLIRKLPPSALDPAIEFVLSDGRGGIVAMQPVPDGQTDSLSSIFGDAQPLTIFGDRAASMVVQLSDGTDAIAARRSWRNGQITIVQPLADILGRSAPWDRIRCLVVCLGFAALILSAGLCAYLGGRARTATVTRERLRRRVDTSLARGRCGVWDWDMARNQIFWSASMYELLGYPAREGPMSLAEVNGLIHPGDNDLHAVSDRLASARLSHLDHDFRARTASGDWMWLRARAEITRDPSDDGLHLVGIAVDISDERSRHERNAMADMRLRDAVEAISEAFVLWDADNRMVLCNSKFRDLHGLSGEMAAPGTTYADIMRLGSSPVVDYQLTRESAVESGARSLEARLSDGRWLHINERRTKDGGFVSVGSDITVLKQNEEKLLGSERRLMTTVADLRRSRQALQRQTQQLAALAERYLEQKADAEAANSAKTEFLAKMSHELRTPLNAVIGFADLMQTEIFGPIGHPRYGTYASDIHASALYLLSVIDDILDMSRIEAGKYYLSLAPVAVDDIIERSLDAMADAAAAKGISISRPRTLGTVIDADALALQQGLKQLLQNAIKFTPEGGAVRVRAKATSRAVHLFVEDSGIGMPRDFLSRLGRPFEQVETEFRRAQSGFGLGLAITKALVGMHDGRLRIRSREGVGTVVMMCLPLPSADVLPTLSRCAARRPEPMLIAAE